MPVNIKIIGVIACTWLWITPLAAEEWGTWKGRVVVAGELPDVAPLVAKGDQAIRDSVCVAHDVPDDSLRVDPESRGLANVFVFLRRKPAIVHPDLESSAESEVVFDQKDCRFVPHAMVVRTGQTVLVKSDDPTNHNTHTHPTFNTPENFLVQPNSREGVPLEFRLPEPVPVKVTCDLHPWMNAYWLVINHPYAAVTNEEGEFLIEHLPAGTQTFRVWHERAGWIDKSMKVEISAHRTLEQPPIEVDVDKLLEN